MHLWREKAYDYIAYSELFDINAKDSYPDLPLYDVTICVGDGGFKGVRVELRQTMSATSAAATAAVGAGLAQFGETQEPLDNSRKAYNAVERLDYTKLEIKCKECLYIPALASGMVKSVELSSGCADCITRQPKQEKQANCASQENERMINNPGLAKGLSELPEITNASS